MVRNTAGFAGISVYWPLWLVCICGIVLIVIAFLALLLIKGQNDLPATWKLHHAVKKRNERLRRTNQETEIQFFRIGRDGEAKKVSVKSQTWISVGAGEKAAFCLDTDDKKLAERHFQICVNGSVLMVASLDEETFVNGVPIRKLGTVQAYSGDLIRAGSYEYRVIFSPSEEKENAT